MMTKFTIEQNKKLIELFPYLLPRNLWNDTVSEDYRYDYIRGTYELPVGWYRLFLLYCLHIKPYLVKENLLNKFRFSQIKEKCGHICLYDFGSTREIHDVTSMFTRLSSYVCEWCGQPAKYETKGWIACLCKKCVGEDKKNSYRIHRKMTLRVEHFDYSKNKDGEKYVRKLSLKNLWKEYIRCLKLTDEQFYDYIVERGTKI